MGEAREATGERDAQVELLHVALELIPHVVGLLHRPEGDVVGPAPVGVRVWRKQGAVSVTDMAERAEKQKTHFRGMRDIG